MNSLLYAIWNVDPTLFEIGPITIRWYGVLFAASFFFGYMLMQRFLTREGLPKDWVDSLLIYTMVGTVVGARLGHVFFYQWDYYQDHLLEILMVWEGGLASHGAAVGIILALYLWSRKISKKSILWALDRVVVTVALSGLFIRLGNFFNHEIVGKPTGTDGGVKFLRNMDDITAGQLQQATQIDIWPDGQLSTDALNEAYDKLATSPDLLYVLDQIPNRYPAQLYEAGSYLLIFFLLMALYYKTDAGRRPGLLFGLFLVLIFTARFIIEFYKEVQVAFEENMALDMGQWLSIPLVVVGLVFVGWSLMKKPQPA